MSWAAMGMGAFDTLVSNSSDAWGTGKSARNEKQEEEHNLFLKREREGISARVEGAKAAGIHPLVAMGYQAGPGPITHMSHQTSSPSPSYDSAPSMPTSEPPTSEDQDRINKANVRIAEANADQAELSAHMAYRNLATQPGQAIPVVNTQEPSYTSPSNLRRGIKVKPDEVTASRSSGGLGVALTAGTHPGATDFQVPVGRNPRTLRLPSGKLAESLEDLDVVKTLLVLQMNAPAAWDAIKNDIPWSTRGYLQDLRKAVGLPPAGKRRRGGATGSW